MHNQYLPVHHQVYNRLTMRPASHFICSIRSAEYAPNPTERTCSPATWSAGHVVCMPLQQMPRAASYTICAVVKICVPSVTCDTPQVLSHKPPNISHTPTSLDLPCTCSPFMCTTGYIICAPSPIMYTLIPNYIM